MSSSRQSRMSGPFTLDSVEWGYNCLTGGVHHGRPEAIWNLPLIQTVHMQFSPVQIQTLVVARVHQDALMFVENSALFEELGQKPYTKEWADRVKEAAAPKVLPVYQQKIGELDKYYKSSHFKRDIDGAIERYVEGKLNPGYEVLHPHDTLNLLCRIVGQSALYTAAKEAGE